MMIIIYNASIASIIVKTTVTYSYVCDVNLRTPHIHAHANRHTLYTRTHK